MANMIVQGAFVVDPADRDAFIAGSTAGMEASRAEAGCLEYVFAPDPIDPSRVVLSERWESKEHLDDHMKLQATRQIDRPKPQSASVVVYEAEVVKVLA